MERETSHDLARWRADTPGCATVLHLNNAGAALPPRPVYETLTAHLAREYAIGGYEAKEEADARLDAVYQSLARLINARPDELAVVENATRAFDMGFHSIPFQPDDVIYTSVAEYASNYLAYLRAAESTGVTIEVVPNDEHGQLDVAALDRLLAASGPGRRARLVALSHIPTQSGLVQPATAIGRVARTHGALYLLDATQSVGQLPLDVEALGCDLLCGTARKYLRGPRGVGFLYVRRDLLPMLRPPFVDLHAATWTAPASYELRPDARRFENWESNIAGTLGLGAAVDYALGLDLAATWTRIQTLAARLRAGLRTIPGITVHDRGAVLGGLVTFSVAGRDVDALKGALHARADRPDGTAGARPINVSVSRASSALLDFATRDVASWLRASVHYYNSEAELDEFLGAVATLASRRGT